MEIKKKCWPQSFQLMLDSKKNFDLRLADFDLKDNDTIVYEEWDPITKKYSGRKLTKVVKNLRKFKATEFNSIQDIEKYGHYAIEFK